MGKIDAIYKQILHAIDNQGFAYQDIRRSNVTRKQIKSITFEYPMSDGFPLLSLKKMPFKLIVSELLWFLTGGTNIKYLLANNNLIWVQDAYNYYVHICALEDIEPEFTDMNSFVLFLQREDYTKIIEHSKSIFNNNYTIGDVGKNYSYQWCNWEGEKNQLFSLVSNLIRNPMDTRHIVTAWNPTEIWETALPPCHWSFEILCAPIPKWRQDEEGLPEYGFTLKWHQRSVDTFLGLPFNIASYALLGIIIQTLTGHHFMSLIADLSNVHIYSNHDDAIKQIQPLLPDTYGSPEVQFADSGKKVLTDLRKILIDNTVTEDLREKDFIHNLLMLEVSDFELHHYQSFDKINAEMVAPDDLKS